MRLRPRIEGESPLPAVREWQRLNLRYQVEVSEILEVFMEASQSDLVGRVPRSMMKVARQNFGLRALPVGPKSAPVSIKLLWHASRELDPAHAFLRKQIDVASRDVVPHGSR